MARLVVLSVVVCLTALGQAKGEGGQADGCTNGFMSLERMNQVIENYVVGAPWNRQIIAPVMTFACNGNIQSLLFGANRFRNYAQYPEFQIWRPSEDNTHHLVSRSSVSELQRVSGPLYQLNVSMGFREGDILGFYQPPDEESRLRLLLAIRAPLPVQILYYRTSNELSDFITSSASSFTRNPLVSVVTDSPSGCVGSGFMSEDTLRSRLGLTGVGRLVNRSPRQIITPDINFICNGMITKWIVGALRQYNVNYAAGPQLQLWRNTVNDTYVKINETLVMSEAYNNSFIYHYTGFSPIPFQAGDVLGIYLPSAGTTTLRLRFELGNGQQNYIRDDRQPPPHEELQLSDLSTEEYYPLVSLEISVSPSSAQIMTSSFAPSVAVSVSSSPVLSTDLLISTANPVSASDEVFVSPSSTVAHTHSPSPPPTDLLTSTPRPSISESSEASVPPTTTATDLTHTPSPPPPPGTSPPDSQSQSPVGPVIGAGVGVALLLGLLVLGVCLGLVWIRRKRSSKVVLQQLTVTRNFSNPVYEGTGGDGLNGAVVIQGNKPAVQDGGIYDSPYSEYDSVAAEAPPRKETVAEFDNPLYSDTGPVTFSETTLYESTDFGGSACPAEECSYVPTTVCLSPPVGDCASWQSLFLQVQRETSEASGNIYSSPEMEVVKSGESTEYAYITTRAGRKSEYFEESSIYWTPATNVSDLYEQLSQHNYREIPRQHIEVGGSLGSGQFGVVSRGRWLAAVGGPTEVAIKTLRPEAREEDKLKFLQEAAINGQFRHPNIVRLHGVVTVGEPVMIVLEFLPNGDLRDFLNSLKSQPGQQEQTQLSQLCLTFSQQIASGMAYLAGKAFVHRDLAARNILVSEKRVCKVADFGMARDLEEGSYYISHGGKIPVKWTAPEALHYKKYSTASDVWSFGCLMYEIWSLGHKPFEGYTNAQVMNLVTEGYRLTPPPGCPRAIYSLMITCWNPEKSSRPSFASLRETLTGDPDSLLQWREEERGSLARSLGASLEAGKDLYCDLQETYLQKQ